MKNHFFFPYCGNKRNEVERLYKQFEDRMDKIDTIIEPYCGSCVFSYYVWTQNKERNIKYILNDTDEGLISLLKMVKENPDELNALNDEINEFKKTMDKTSYNEIVKKKDFKGYLLANMYYNIRVGLFPDVKKCPKNKELMKTPMVDFLLNADIEIKNEDGLNLFVENINEEKTMIFLDPPYILSSNTMYQSFSDTIYKYISKNDLSAFKSHILICIEKNFITDLIFNEDDLVVYDKTYTKSQNKTQHIIYYNKNVKTNDIEEQLKEIEDNIVNRKKSYKK